MIHSDGTVEIITRPETPEEEYARLNPPPPPPPSLEERFAATQNDYDNLIVDLTYRTTLLELGVM